MKIAVAALALSMSVTALDAASGQTQPAETLGSQKVTATAASVEARPVVAKGDLVETLRADGRFSTVLEAMEATNLIELVKTSPNLTLFAPTDAAFAVLPPAQLEGMMQDKPALQKLLVQHLVNAPLKTTKFMGAKGEVPTVGGAKVLIDGSGDALKVGRATIEQGDVIASNGVLHVIDKVLLLNGVAQAVAKPANQSSPS
jgi:uncharacterized surface protein with fasciclin (FAS1) repeats